MQLEQGGFGEAHVVARHFDVVVVGERAADRFVERERERVAALYAETDKRRQRRHGATLRAFTAEVFGEEENTAT